MNEDRETKSIVKRAFGWALSVDAESNKEYIANLKQKYPKASREKLVGRIIRRARWWGVASGVMTGLPANPWVAVPAAITDVGALLRVEVVMASRIALLYDPVFLDDREPPYELLIPIFGLNAASKTLKDLGVLGGMRLIRARIKKHLSKETLRQFEKVMLKYFGRKVTQKSVISKTIPIVGGIIGGGWNFAELGIIGKRVVSYFENEPIEVGE